MNRGQAGVGLSAIWTEDEDGMTVKPLEVNVSVSSLKNYRNVNTTQTTSKQGKVVQKIELSEAK